MSYDIYLADRITGEPLEIEEAHHMGGGTYAMSGTNEAWLNIIRPLYQLLALAQMRPDGVWRGD